jgi:hypothetical protein
MRGRGINYDTGFFPGGRSSRVAFDPEVVRRELRVIADELHCNAVRISGGDPERLGVAAEAAAAAGLEVWFAPFPCELTLQEMLELFADCARRAEAVRLDGAEVVFVTGCEVSLFARGLIPGDTVYDRMTALASGDPAVYASMADVPARMNAFLADAAATVRGHFGGRVTYASGPWEDIDWSPFDIVGVDAYRDARNAETYREEIRSRFVHGKPVAATEFGCCAYAGAGERGALGWTIVDRSVVPPRLDGRYARDEQEQVRYLNEVLEILETEGVDSAFWFTFAGYELPHDPNDPEHDLDMASYGVVKVLPGGGRDGLGWEPKASFHALAAAYAKAAIP